MTLRTFHPRQRLSEAFSLIEIMVAVTLLSVLTVGLLAMFYQTQKAFRLGANQADTLEGGRAALQIIARDLQEMSPSYWDPIINFQAVTGSTARLLMDLPGGGDRTNLLQDVSFLSRRGDQWIGTTYRVDDGDDNAPASRTGVGTLYRWSPPPTNGPTSRPQLGMSNVAWMVRQPIADIENDLNFDRILDGVVHFRVIAYDNFGNPYTTNRLGPRIDVTREGAPEEYRFYDWVPGYLDIELGILDPKAMEQHRARSNPALARQFLEDQGHRVQLFKQRVPIRARHSQFEVFVSQ